MASTSSTRSESPVDIDFSVIRTSIQMGHKMIDQILQGIHYGSDEVRNLLREECDFIMECKVCRNLFRSFPNFVAHKRVYCMEYYAEKMDSANLAPVLVDEETVVIQPEAPEESSQNKKDLTNLKHVSKTSSDIEKVVNRTFEGKSKEYQLYTKVAENVEKRKSTKVTNTIVLTPMPATSNAVVVTHAKGDQSHEMQQKTSPKKQSPVKSIEEVSANSPAKKKNSVLAVCADLAKKKLMQDGKIETVNALPLKTRASTRSRKSSPRKSTEYLEMSTKQSSSKNSKSVGTEEEGMDVEEWNDNKISPDKKEGNDNVNDKELLKFCNLKNLSCRVCRRKFTSLYNLKLHGKIKHGISLGKFPCSICESKFEHLKSLYKHLREKHGKCETYISNIKRKFLSNTNKPTEEMEVEDDSGSSSSSSASPASPIKENKNMLSFSTGWKKCDKCGKVCWKAKSFYRHYSQCKGNSAKSESNSASNSPVKSGKQNAIGNQKNTTALLKLQEKLRAGVIQTASSDNTVKSKLREKNSKSESDTRNTNSRESASSERFVDGNVAHTELFKALTQPLKRECEDAKTTVNVPVNSREGGQVKSYNLRQSNEREEKATESISKEHAEQVVDLEKSENKEVQAIGSPAFKKLEERLVREAGLKDAQNTENKAEVTDSYNARHTGLGKGNASELKESQATEPKEDNVGRSRKISSESGNTESVAKLREQKSQRESPGIKQLEIKLTREVGNKAYGTRQVMQVKSKEVEGKEKSAVEKVEISQRKRNKSSESGNEDVAKVKEHRVCRESPEIKLLEEKLTREALGHKDVLEDKESKLSDIKKRTPKGVKDSTEEASEKTSLKVDKILNESEVLQTGRSTKRALSGETENRKERISEKLREKMASQEQMIQESKTRLSRSVSRDSDNKVQDQTPEKLSLMTNLSPVSSPGRSSFLPSSPTPSLQSNSGDSYNMKFKMTVQEMAELVESASLTKFAKERKKRAKSFLNSKQVKESMKVAPSLSKPMKRGSRKKTITIRNVYGTRNRTPGSVSTEESKFIPSTRFSSQQSDSDILDKTGKMSESKAEGNDTSVDSVQDKQNATKRLSREQKRLQNSAGFVEKNFYSVSASRDSSRDRHSDADSEKRQLSRERKRLENSQGLVDKSFFYESDSSVERDRRSVHKSRKSHDKGDTIEDLIHMDSDVSIKSKSPLDKSLQKSEIIDLTESSKVEHDNAMKQKNIVSMKKTVLYVGRDFTDKIKSMQRRGSDASSETVENRTESGNRNVSEIVQKKKSADDKTEVKEVDKSVQEQRKNLCDKDVEKLKQNASDKSKPEESPKHRTRLATGSIFFDSELLKLSPSKMEKKFAELNKEKETTKAGHDKDKHSPEPASVRKRLSLSPKKVQVETLHQRSKSGPRRFSLSTGVKQCQKCQKTFWKKKAYVFHLVNSSCADKTLSRLDRKRALSLSPEGTVKGEGRFGTVKRIFKKAKREVKGSENEKVVNDKNVVTDSTVKASGDTGIDPLRVTKHQTTLKSFENTVSNKKTNSQTGKGDTDQIDKIEHQQIRKSSARLIKERIDQEKEIVKEERSLRKRGAGDIPASDKDKTVETLKKSMVISEKQNETVNIEVEGSRSEMKSCKDSDIEISSTVSDIGITENNNKNRNKTKNVTGSVVPQTVKKELKETSANLMDVESEHKADLLELQKESSKLNEKVNKEPMDSNVSTVIVSEEVPGPSTSLAFLFSEDSDDNSSDFSGFSEDDLKQREQEVSQMDIGEFEELEDDVEDIDADDDIEEMSDYPGAIPDTEHDPKPNNQSPSTSQRPVRKSAQNRFAHVEEIWVYKEPGKPTVEKIKGVKNREYVIDVTNPSKLQCHNSKDVDRLIDEKNLKCMQCETPCTSISNLRRHVIRHLGWKRYKCKHCAYTCYDMSYCRQHVLRAHDENLTNKNFDKFITDLKKEATKKRAAKRTNTLHKSKQNSLEEEMNKKMKTNALNFGTVPKINSEQTKVNTPTTSVQRSNIGPVTTNSKFLRSKDSNNTTVAKEKSSHQPGIVIKSETPELSSVKKETLKGELKSTSPLDKARLNLAKALCNK